MTRLVWIDRLLTACDEVPETAYEPEAEFSISSLAEDEPAAALLDVLLADGTALRLDTNAAASDDRVLAILLRK